MRVFVVFVQSQHSVLLQYARKFLGDAFPLAYDVVLRLLSLFSDVALLLCDVSPLLCDVSREIFPLLLPLPYDAVLLLLPLLYDAVPPLFEVALLLLSLLFPLLVPLLCDAVPLLCDAVPLPFELVFHDLLETCRTRLLIRHRCACF